MMPSKANVLKLEETIKKLPQADLHIDHLFIPGCYMRPMFIPKDTVLTGKVHNHDSFTIVLMGDISLMTDVGMVRVKAPWYGVSKAGIKRVGFAHEDTVFITVHRTDETDPEKLELELVSETYEDFERLSYDICSSSSDD